MKKLKDFLKEAYYDGTKNPLGSPPSISPQDLAKRIVRLLDSSTWYQLQNELNFGDQKAIIKALQTIKYDEVHGQEKGSPLHKLYKK